MADTLLFRGGSSTDIAASTVQSREIVIDTDTDQIVLGSAKKRTIMNGDDITIDSSGDVLIGGTLPSAPNIALNANGSASFNAGTVNIDSSGRLLVGTSTARDNFDNGAYTAAIQTESVDGVEGGIAVIANRSSANVIRGAHLRLARSGSTTFGSNALVANGNSLGILQFLGADGTDFVQAASIQAQVDGTPGANDMPGRLVFSTTADGASSPTERMRIDSSGDVKIGGTLPSAPNIALNANGSAEFAGAVQISGDGRTGTDVGYYFAEAGTLSITKGTGSTSPGVIIYQKGTTSPNISLNADGTITAAGGKFEVTSVGNDVKLALSNAGDNQAYIGKNGNDTFGLCNTTAALTAKNFAIELNANTGSITAAGDITCTDNSKGLILKSPDGTSFRLSVANDGTLSASSI